MPDYRVTHSFLDVNGGETTKTYTGEFADDTTARAAANTLLLASQALTDAALYKEEFTGITLVASVVGPNSNVFERIEFTTTLVNKQSKYTSTFPSPIEDVFSGNGLLFNQTPANEYDDYIANFEAGGGWNVSDGDVVGGTLAGSRVFRGSGKTNLPK